MEAAPAALAVDDLVRVLARGEPRVLAVPLPAVLQHRLAALARADELGVPGPVDGLGRVALLKDATVELHVHRRVACAAVQLSIYSQL
jgi:hypothetical protein